MSRKIGNAQSRATFFRHCAVFQRSCWVSSLLLEREKGKQLHRPIELVAKRFRALAYFFNEYGKNFNSVNNKMLEYDWLLTTLI